MTLSLLGMPRDISLSWMSYLSVKELCNLAFVCKGFSDLTHAEILWKERLDKASLIFRPISIDDTYKKFYGRNIALVKVIEKLRHSYTHMRPWYWRGYVERALEAEQWKVVCEIIKSPASFHSAPDDSAPEAFHFFFKIFRIGLSKDLPELWHSIFTSHQFIPGCNSFGETSEHQLIGNKLIEVMKKGEWQTLESFFSINNLRLSDEQFKTIFENAEMEGQWKVMAHLIKKSWFQINEQLRDSVIAKARKDNCVEIIKAHAQLEYELRNTEPVAY